ncbi:MAG: hypothetical protein KDA66_05835, partial [Planctomycetaceae bacterium]|nr:hypothetical protein [Planctomycetaceae bacterium]
MLRFLSLSGLLSILLFSFAHAEERHWSCEDVDPTEFVTHGNIRSGAGVNGKSFVLDGLSLLKVRASEEFANAPAGFTWSVWVNPYLL